MKIMTIVGTRPELIRLSLIINALDNAPCKHVLVDSLQNSQDNMSKIFYDQLGIREPDYTMSPSENTSLGHKLGDMFHHLEAIIKKEKPDKALILGDTNTSLCALLIERLGVPVYHMEAGNRCYDKRVPEEINRRAIDAVSSYNLPYTEMSKQNLLINGIPKEKIFVTGNPIYEVLQYNKEDILKSNIFRDLNIAPFSYCLVTCHRAETVDNSELFGNILAALDTINKKMRVIYPVHPRAKQKMKQFKLDMTYEYKGGIRMIPPLGFIDFAALERHANIIVTDSGTVQEEANILRIPSVIIRNSCERQEVIESGGSIVTGTDNHHTIVDCANYMDQISKDWGIPKGYLDTNVSTKVVQFMLGSQL